MINGKLLSTMIISGTNSLYNNRELIDRLNVFPVPDGDTGKNMYLTMQGVAKALQKFENSSSAEVAEAVAGASLRSARGNSGVILSQILRGFARGVKTEHIDATVLELAFSKAAETAYRAVMKPTEGTILTVIREAAAGIKKAKAKSNDVLYCFEAGTEAAKAALEKTQEMLPKLKEAGVVDAGGKGLVCILDGMLYTLKTNKIIEANDTTDEAQVEGGIGYEQDITFTYCTEFIINKTNSGTAADSFKNFIENLGDCMMVIDDYELIKVHIHTDNPGVVLQEALKLGSLSSIKIDNMKNQQQGIIEGKAASDNAKPKPVGIIAVSTGEGISELLLELGADYIVEGGQTMNPSAGDILAAVEKVNAQTVYVLPNNKNIILAAQQAKELCSSHIEVIPTKSIPQGIGALIAYDEGKSALNNVQAMTQAAENIKTGYVTYAVRATELSGKKISDGDILGLIEDKLLHIGNNNYEIAQQLVHSMATSDTSVITILSGEAVEEEEAQKLKTQLEQELPGIDIVHYNGRQPLYYYIISAE